jgi:hypothetical protein
MGSCLHLLLHPLLLAELSRIYTSFSLQLACGEQCHQQFYFSLEHEI